MIALTAVILTSFWLPLLVWTAVGALVAGAGSWTRFTIFCVISVALWWLAFHRAFEPMPFANPDEDDDFFRSGMEPLITGAYAIVATAIFALLTRRRANHFMQIALSKKGPE